MNEERGQWKMDGSWGLNQIQFMKVGEQWNAVD